VNDEFIDCGYCYVKKQHRQMNKRKTRSTACALNQACTLTFNQEQQELKQTEQESQL